MAGPTGSRRTQMGSGVTIVLPSVTALEDRVAQEVPGSTRHVGFLNLLKRSIETRFGAWPGGSVSGGGSGGGRGVAVPPTGVGFLPASRRAGDRGGRAAAVAAVAAGIGCRAQGQGRAGARSARGAQGGVEAGGAGAGGEGESLAAGAAATCVRRVAPRHGDGAGAPALPPSLR